MMLLLFLLIGITAGFVLATPPGPIAGVLIRQVAAGKPRSGLRVAAGATLMDIVYVFVSANLSSWFLAIASKLLAITGKFLSGIMFRFRLLAALWILMGRWYLVVFQVICIIITAAIGIKCVAHPPAMKVARLKEAQNRSGFWLGVSVSALNLVASPTVLAAYILTIGWLHARGWVPNSFLANSIYSIGFGVGTMGWFVFLVWGIWKLRDRHTFIRRLQQVTGWLLILSAVALELRLVWSFITVSL